MKGNEITGLVFILFIVLMICVVTGSITNTKGYDSGYADALAGKENKWDVRYDYRYPDAMWPANSSYNAYLNNSDKIMKGGEENDQFGTGDKIYGNETLQDRSKTETHLQPDRDTQKIQWKNLWGVGWFLQSVLYFVVNHH